MLGNYHTINVEKAVQPHHEPMPDEVVHCLAGADTHEESAVAAQHHIALLQGFQELQPGNLQRFTSGCLVQSPQTLWPLHGAWWPALASDFWRSSLRTVSLIS